MTHNQPKRPRGRWRWDWHIRSFIAIGQAAAEARGGGSRSDSPLYALLSGLLVAFGVARAAYFEHVAGIEREWGRRCGTRAVRAVREAAELPLLSGLTPSPDGWRAQLPSPDTLPHFPFVSHRGGYPDGG